MLALKIILTVLLILIFSAMLVIMVIFERDKPRNIILWAFVLLLLPIIGEVAYIIHRSIYYKKRKTLLVKQKEDKIYSNLISNELWQNDSNGGELFDFNKMAFNANLTTNNYYEMINSYAKFKESLIKDIQNANSYILFEFVNINFLDFQTVFNALKNRAQAGVNVRFVYQKHIKKSNLKILKSYGIKVNRFSKHNTMGSVYSNLRNSIVIDGKIAYSGNFNIRKQDLNPKYDVLNTYIKFKGEIVQEIDIKLHEDVVFASGKFLDYNAPSKEKYLQPSKIQFVSNEVETNIELLLIKAICMAKSSIWLQLNTFIPTESIMSLIRFAINSKIEVKLILPINADKHSKYYASRAYAKELALFGADVYLFDGFIRFNAITIDSNFVLYGSFILDREHIGTSQQSVFVIEDSKAVNYFKKTFDLSIDNSYKIANAKMLLVKERFAKNFV